MIDFSQNQLQPNVKYIQDLKNCSEEEIKRFRQVTGLNSVQLSLQEMKCQLCTGHGHHVAECETKKNIDKALIHVPGLREEWIAYKFRKLTAYKAAKAKKAKKKESLLERKRKRIVIRRDRINHIESTWQTGIDDLENQITNFTEY